jgi:hypothetical protein
MPAALPLVAGLAAQGVAAAGFGIAFGTFTSAVIGGVVSTLARGFMPKPKAPDVSSLLNQPGAGRTQQVRQPITAHQIVFGMQKMSGPILFVHTAPDQEGRDNGFLYMVHGISGVSVSAMFGIRFNEESPNDYPAWVRITPHLGASDQAADADFVSEIGDPHWGADHRLRGRAYLASRLKWSPEVFPSGIPNITAIVVGHDEIYDPRRA